MEQLEKILAVSAELFSQYGFKSITMDDIARRAGISKKTLYVHFANKEEVVNESVIWYKNQTTAICEQAVNEAENSVEAIVRILAFFDTVHRQINPMALFELQRYYPEAYKSFRNLLAEKDVTMLRENIQRGIADGLYREDVNADIMARYRLESSLMMFQPNLMVNDRNSLMDVAMEIGEHFLYGLMTEKGKQLYTTYKGKYLKQSTKI